MKAMIYEMENIRAEIRRLKVKVQNIGGISLMQTIVKVNYICAIIIILIVLISISIIMKR